MQKLIQQKKRAKLFLKNAEWNFSNLEHLFFFNLSKTYPA